MRRRGQLREPRRPARPNPRKPEASSSPSTFAIVDDGGGRRLAARGQQPVSIDERARPLDRSAAMHDPTFVSAPQRCDRPSMRSTQPPINTDLRSCRACTAVVVCIRQCQNPRSSSMQACRTKANHFQSCFWFWDSGLSRNFMLFCGP